MDLIKSLMGTGASECEHRPDELATPNGNRCEECGSTHSLRMCATCGHVGCCESQARDAETHFRKTGHAVMASMPVGKGFQWCYEEKRYVD
jgi:uncharacterized UBP type Zn finger protein